MVCGILGPAVDAGDPTQRLILTHAHKTAIFPAILAGMELNENKAGYWAGMSTRLKARVMGWSIYWARAIWLITIGSLMGFAMVALPLIWIWAKAWFLDGFLELDSTENGLLDYTLGYVWNSSIYVRSFFMVSVLALGLGGLGWLGTEDLRQEAAEPTFTEQITEKASGMAEATAERAGAVANATKETTSGWFATAKGWFSGGDASED